VTYTDPRGSAHHALVRQAYPDGTLDLVWVDGLGSVRPELRVASTGSARWAAGSWAPE
jgi:hypothetical protein